MYVYIVISVYDMYKLPMLSDKRVQYPPKKEWLFIVLHLAQLVMKFIGTTSRDRPCVHSSFMIESLCLMVKSPLLDKGISSLAQNLSFIIICNHL